MHDTASSTASHRRSFLICAQHSRLRPPPRPRALRSQSVVSLVRQLMRHRELANPRPHTLQLIRAVVRSLLGLQCGQGAAQEVPPTRTQGRRRHTEHVGHRVRIPTAQKTLHDFGIELGDEPSAASRVRGATGHLSGDFQCPARQHLIHRILCYDLLLALGVVSSHRVEGERGAGDTVHSPQLVSRARIGASPRHPGAVLGRLRA